MTEPFITQQRHSLSAIQRATDSLCVIASLYVSQWLVGQAVNENTLVVGLAASTLFLLAARSTVYIHKNGVNRQSVNCSAR